MGLLDDNPATEDLLGFSGMADVLHNVIRDTPKRPFTIGVFGEWGSGKTTLMKLVESRLQASGVKTVWFNAWKYDGKEAIWNALIQQIFYTMQRDPSLQTWDHRKFRKRVAHAAGELAKYAAKIATRFVPGEFVKEEDVDAVLKALRPPSANDSLFDFINRFEETFDRLVKEYVGESGYLVIFIDDLDRCLPENAITVMESLKLYLDRASSIFVIGAESSVIEEGINQRYHNNPRLSGKDYLEKVIQLPFVVPQIEAHNALSLLEGHQRTLAYKEDQLMQTLIVEGTECNPRRLKRLINALLVLAVCEGELTIEQWRLAAKIALIKMRFPQYYYALIEDPDLIATMTDTLTRQPNERKQTIESSQPHIRALYDDRDLRTFLERTSEIHCPAEQVKEWVELTKGQAGGAVKSVLEATQEASG